MGCFTIRENFGPLNYQKKKYMKKLVDYYADWCGPCKVMEHTLDELSKEFPGQVEKIDVDTNHKTVQDNNVMSIPTYIILEDGKEIKRFIGATEKSVLVSALS